ncbi:MAG TPA: hypothetical protein DEH78_09875 [Solibacterales bacterium]|nr:hypothetical protein [Bryobacterales bacterium]
MFNSRRAVFVLYSAALLLQGQNSATRYLSIQAMISEGDLAGARREIDRRLAAGPADGGMWNLLGIVEAQEGRIAEAEAAFSRAVRHEPKLLGAYLNLGRAQSDPRNGRPGVERAVATWRALLSAVPGHVEGRERLAESLLWLGRFPESARQAALLPAGRGQAVRCACELALKRAPVSCREMGSEEEVWLVAPVVEGAEAERVLAGLFQALPEISVRGKVRLVRALRRSGSAAKADELLASLDESNPDVLAEQASSAYESRDLRNALLFAGRARQIAPERADLHFFFGLAAAESDLPVEAQNALRRAVELDGTNPTYRFALGAALMQGYPAEAVPHLEAYVKANPKDPRGRFVLGAAHYQARNVEEAARELRLAVTDTAARPGALYFLGRIAQDEARDAEAIASLTECARLVPAYPDAKVALATSYLRLGRFAEAAEQIDQALTLDPDLLKAHVARLRLYQQTKDPRAEAQREAVRRVEGKQLEKRDLLLRRIEIRPN